MNGAVEEGKAVLGAREGAGEKVEGAVWGRWRAGGGRLGGGTGGYGS